MGDKPCSDPVPTCTYAGAAGGEPGMESVRYAKRTDDNHESVVRALRLILAKNGSVHDLSGAGRGTPDIMVGYQGRNFLFEIKDGTKSPSRRKLTPAQQRFHRGWRGQVDTIETAAEAMEVILQSTQ